MTRGKPKVEPLNAMKVQALGTILVRVKPEDFIELVTGKDLEIIQGRVGTIARYYVYIAPDARITYYTKTKNQIPEIKADIITEVLYLGGIHP